MLDVNSLQRLSYDRKTEAQRQKVPDVSHWANVTSIEKLNRLCNFINSLITQREHKRTPPWRGWKTKTGVYVWLSVVFVARPRSQEKKRKNRDQLLELKEHITIYLLNFQSLFWELNMISKVSFTVLIYALNGIKFRPCKGTYYNFLCFCSCWL